MKKFFSLLLIAIFMLFCVGCGEATISVNNDGYIVVDGKVTEYRVMGDEGLSAYELYLKNNPSYTGSETKWLRDILEGNIILQTHEQNQYSIISNGELTQEARLLRGSAVSANSLLSTSNAVLALNTPIIVPVASDASFNITIEGVLMPQGSGGGHFLSSDYINVSNRIHFGTNYDNGNVFIGANINGTYFLYEFNVGQNVLKSDNSYEFLYENEELKLMLNGVEMSLSSLSLSQGDRVSVTNGAVATKELMRKIFAMRAQSYFTFDYIGSDSHKSTSQIRTLSVETSPVNAYRKNAKHPLKDSVIYYLGSSITEGHGSDAFDACVRDLIGNQVSFKSAIGGTTMVKSDNGESFVERLASGHLNTGGSYNIEGSLKPDILLVQMSTNDFGQNKPLGSISDNFDDDFDVYTVCVAIEYINAFIKEKSPETRVVFWAGAMKTSYEKYTQYGEFLTNYLIPLGEKWGFEIVDMYNLEYTQNNAYFKDDIHYTTNGYRAVVFPSIAQKLIELLA